MENVEKKDKVQKEALSEWVKNGKRGTCEIITGLGKTFIGLHALYTMPKNNTEHLFLAEVVDRKHDLLKDIKKYNSIFNRDVLNDYNLKFYCYQSVYKWKNKKVGLIIADEIHDSLTPAYSEFYKNNKCEAIIGLSALIDVDTYYDSIKQTKGYILSRIAPICFKYHLDQGLKEGTARHLDIYVIPHLLNPIDRTIKAGNVKKVFYQTETKAYEYWDKIFNKALLPINYDRKPNELDQSYFNRINKLEYKRDNLIKIAVAKRSKILYDLPSKRNLVLQLLKYIKGKAIIFGNSLDSLLSVTPNVISSRNKDVVNNLIREKFDNDEINIIGSFKKLKQGANLKNLDSCIIMSYYSKEKDLIQRLGRLRDNGEIGKVFILITQHTQEVQWFNKMFENVNNYNFIYCKNIADCINKIK